MKQLDSNALVAAIHRLAETHYGSSAAAERFAMSAPARSEAGVRGANELEGRDPLDLDAELRMLLQDFLPEQQSPIVEARATILLADIRGFTGLMSAYPPPVMVDLLNRYFTIMCETVERYGGRVDKFMGDSVMAVFGLPSPQPDDLRRSLACAVDMQHAMVRLNQGHQQRGEPELHAGVAVSTGAVMAGSFGPPRHSAYTVIGDVVNLASRIESFSLRGQVLISDAAHAGAADFVEVGPANQVLPKGVSGPVRLYPLRAVNYRGRLVVPAVEPRKSPRVRVDLDALFRQVQAKRIANEEFPGHVRDVGYFGLSAELPHALPNLAELAIELPWLGRRQTGQLYARVLRSAQAGARYRTSLEFTAIDTPVHRELKAMVDDRLWHR